MGTLIRRLPLAAIATALACAGASAFAQEEPYRPNTPAPAQPVTSGPNATVPTPAETREAKALSTAVFAKPAAAARAAEKVTAESQPDYAVNIPKPESPLPDGLRPGGKGVELKTPF